MFSMITAPVLWQITPHACNALPGNVCFDNHSFNAKVRMRSNSNVSCLAPLKWKNAWQGLKTKKRERCNMYSSAKYLVVLRFNERMCIETCVF
ncbi:hypothetical protein BC943DRAFT_321234 [Umbelopsis sp. AD052]|nr:hypothetical protein BC943DRAFT_321234 [Umbelopsis sp. AD052]